MSFGDYLNEQVEGSIWQEQVKNEINIAKDKHFKNSLVSFTKGVLGKSTMFGTFYLISDKKDQTNGYFSNDILGLTIIIEKLGEDEYLVEYDYSSITIKPTEKYMAFGSHKVRTRKYKGDIKKIGANSDKLFAKYKEELTKLKNEGKLTLSDELINKYL